MAVASFRSRRANAQASSSPAGSRLTDLKTVGPQGLVTSIAHRGDAFEVMTADGRTVVFREINLRFKIDTSDRGPLSGRPVMLPSGMVGDRAVVFFASPADISRVVEHQS